MNCKDKPPNKSNEQVYRIIKCPLKCVLKKYDIIHPIIEKTVIEINDIIILSYQFIKLYLLDKFTNNQELPTVDKQFVLDVIKTVSFKKGNQGNIIKQENIKNASGKLNIKEYYN